ncbi:hypothetical protein F4821DRAFT_233128 [Hypoxylon rubiginosum]|uniref:Uncharacterized protein n=1 Tax=Hypoxylon rubiginosum TaxID=110542 RepID=A0ACC0D848_9PEZI|nr:hypothetical protein F4821DRAFT_233128 [Hypoxylon rubiginosum]
MPPLVFPTVHRIVDMVNGLERLEKFFGASRRRDKDARYRDTPVASPQSQPDNGPHFPSPSFMRPTSIHMKPREEQIPWTKAVKDRSQSLPDPHYTPKRRASISSTSTVTNHRHQSSDPTRMLSLSIRPVKDPLHGQRLSRFRFPEDSLFKNETVDQASSASERTNGEAQAENMLDWRPQRLSSLFNTLGLDTSIDDRLSRSTEDAVGSAIVKPSPISSTPPSPKTRADPVIQPRLSSQFSTEVPARKLSLLPRLDVLSSVTRTFPDSPPASDGEDDRSPFDRPTSRKGLGSPIVFTPRASTESKFRESSEVRSSRTRSVRESWGAGPEDYVVMCAEAEGQVQHISQPQSLRNSLSRSSLLTIRSTIMKHLDSDEGLTEPTLDDFYALDDEDVAESFSVTPEPDTDIPPTPPPKDSAKTIVGRSRSTRHAPIAPTSTVNTSSGELTPPCTPTDSQFLALTYSPCHASGELGAMRAANIAKTYNFDLVYVISLWPNSEGTDSDPSRRPTSTSPTPRGRGREKRIADDVAAHCAVVTNPKSKITGRLLAGYDLDKFGSPFRVHAQFHTKMLGFSGWQEYRDELASSGMISRGWTCSFYNGHTPTTGTSNKGSQGDESRNRMVDRGIVFAAYSRKTTKSVIPVTSSPKQTAILGKLLYDAQTLVDTLVHGV